MKLKKWISVLLSAVLALSMTGCVGNLYENVAVIDGVEISSGLYLMAQYSAYTVARYGVEDSTNIFKQTYEDQKVPDWIKNETEEGLRRYVCVRRMCRDRDIVLDSEGQSNLEQMMQYWTYLEAVYAENGISESTMIRYYTVDELARQLFRELYAEGGELYVADSELMAEYAENYAHVRVISVPLTRADQTGDVRDEITAGLDELVVKMENGMTLDEAAAQLGPLYRIMGRDNYDPETAPGNIYDNYISYEQPNYDTYSEEFLHYLQGLEVGDYGSYAMDSTAILYEVIPTFADKAAFNDMRDTVLENLKQDDFEDYLRSIYSQYPVQWTPLARWYFRPQKIVD